MAISHHIPHPSTSPKIARPRPKQKTIFDGTKLRLEPTDPKTTTYGINCRFRRFSISQNCATFSHLNSRVAAIDYEFRPRHERRLVGGEEQDHVRNFLWCTRPLHRSQRRDRLELILRQDVRHRSLDHPGMDRIDANPVRSIVNRADLAQHADSALGSMIGSRSSGTDYSVNRRDVDDRAAAPLPHRRNRGLHPEPHALLLDRDHAVPFLFAGIFDSAEVADSCIADLMCE